MLGLQDRRFDFKISSKNFPFRQGYSDIFLCILFFFWQLDYICLSPFVLKKFHSFFVSSIFTTFVTLFMISHWHWAWKMLNNPNFSHFSVFYGWKNFHWYDFWLMKWCKMASMMNCDTLEMNIINYLYVVSSSYHHRIITLFL